MPLAAALSFFYHKVFRFFRMSDNVQYCELPISPTSIQEFYTHLRTEYTLYGSNRMKWFTVLEVRHYKERELPEHEYISVKVHGPKGESYLCFERLRGDKTDHDQVSESGVDKPSASASESTSLPSYPPYLPRTPSQTAVDKPSKPKMKLSSPTPSSSIESLNSFVHQRDARDRVAVSPQAWFYDKTDEVHRTLSFRDSPFPLYELVVLAHTIHEARRTYLPFTDNCYFYAATIVKTLQQVYNQAVDVETMGSNNKNGLDSKKRKHTQAGTWSGVELYGGERVDIQPLITQFQEEKEKFKRPVHEYEDRQRAIVEGKRAAEVREVREIEARRVAEEAKRAAEVREVREIEARRAAEEAKKAAEVREIREIEARRVAEEAKKAAEDAKKSAEEAKRAAEVREIEVRRAAEAEIARLKFQLEQVAKRGLSSLAM